MKIDWDVDDDGNMPLSVMTGFGIALLPDALLAVQLRCTGSDEGAALVGRRVQIGMSADAARELAAALLKAAELTGDTPMVGRPN